MSDVCGSSGQINQYLLGNMIRLSVSFLNSDGESVDPTTIILEIKGPDGSIETPTPSKESVGNYFYDYEPLYAGMYYYNFQAFGDVVAMSQGQFKVMDQSI